ncbi:MAG: DUF433 domain-containing protein [Myxococcota bacterium]
MTDPAQDLELDERISIDPDVRFGRAVITGTRVAVEEVVGLVAGGWDHQRVADEFDISPEDVAAALRYAASGDRRLAQYLRIEAVSLRHLPYLVLEALLDSHDQGDLLPSSSIEEAVPWLDNFAQHTGYLEELCHPSAASAA